MSGKPDDKFQDAATNAAKAGSGSKGCPICGKPKDPEFRPFCSRRCRNIDLGRWLDGSYAVPVVEIEDDDGELDRQ